MATVGAVEQLTQAVLAGRGVNGRDPTPCATPSTRIRTRISEAQPGTECECAVRPDQCSRVAEGVGEGRRVAGMVSIMATVSRPMDGWWRMGG